MWEGKFHLPLGGLKLKWDCCNNCAHLAGTRRFGSLLLEKAFEIMPVRRVRDVQFQLYYYYYYYYVFTRPVGKIRQLPRRKMVLTLLTFFKIMF